jgi:hypothetical protein
MKKIFVITTHCSDDYWPEGNFYLNQCLESLYDIKPDKIILVDNQSKNKPNLKKYSELDIEYIYVDNQNKRGLTGAWNIGTNAAVKYGPALICNTNCDVAFDRSYINLYKHIIKDPNHSKTVYGPKTNNPGWQTAQYIFDPTAYILSGMKSEVLNGFCFFFTTDFYHNTKKEDLLFYNEKENPWNGNENIMTKWVEDKKICIKILNNCFVYHKKEASWRKKLDIEKKLRIEKKDSDFRIKNGLLHNKDSEFIKI